MATAFITGGNGFLGSHLVESLVAQGHTVRALVRDPHRLRWLSPDSAELVPGDLHRPEALREGVAGADVVYHLAGITNARNEADMYRVNLEGTRAVLEACLGQETPPKLLFLSSQAAGGPSFDGTPVTEDAPPHPQSSYGRSKWDAEQLVQAHADELPVVIVRPPSVYGPRDAAFLTLFRSARHGVMPLPDGTKRISLVYVDDVVRGIELAAAQGKGTYNVTDGVEHEMEDFLRTIGQSVGRSVHILRIPAPLFVGGVWTWERVAGLVGKLPPMTVDRAREALCPDWICSDARARRELGYESRWSLADGVRQTTEWYRSEGWL